MCERLAQTIPHPTVPEERKVVNQTADQEVQTGVMTGQQCLRPSVYQASHQMDARSVWLSSQINVGESSQIWKLHWMATTHNRTFQEVRPRNRRDSQGSHDASQKKFALHQGEAYTPETCNTDKLRGKKEKDIHTKAYGVQKTMFSDQTGRFPTKSRQGNKCIMVMVKIDSNVILVEPMKSHEDAEMIRA